VAGIPPIDVSSTSATPRPQGVNCGRHLEQASGLRVIRLPLMESESGVVPTPLLPGAHVSVPFDSKEGNAPMQITETSGVQINVGRRRAV
jgi:hypothetical protein